MSQKKQVVFFIDRALESKPLLAALRQSGATIEIHSDHFLPDAPDTEWLAVVSKKAWVVLTKDARIGRNPEEIRAIARESTSIFILWDGNLRSQQIASLFAEIVPKLEKLALAHQTPFIAKIYKDGTIKLWKNSNQLLKLLT